MGKPALRIGDLTAHGGTVTVGKPTVMIGKMPASTLGDMHVCPMTTGPVPHVGGPAVLGSTGVFLSKMPSARVSDMHVCVGPPSMGAMGCMTVLIGEAGSGGDAGNAAAAAAAASASKKGPQAIKPFDLAEPPEPRTEIHWVEAQVVDSAGLPLGNVRYKLKDPDGNDIVGTASPEGRVRHDGYVQAGSFKIEFPGVENAKWPSAKCKPGQALKLKAEATGFKDGTPAMVVVFEDRDGGRVKRQLARVPGKVQGSKVEVEWTMLKEHYPLPADEKKDHVFEENPKGKIEYFFFVEVEGLIALSDRAAFLEDAEIAVTDKDGKPMGEREFHISFIDGTFLKGMLDKDGKAKEQDVPVGPYRLSLVGVEKKPAENKPTPGLKKGDKGPAVEEINIRLSGFGGGVPKEEFDAATEANVKQFQKDYMGLSSPSGIVDNSTAKSIDEFGKKFPFDFGRLKCRCGTCTGFGGTDKNEKGKYTASHDEAYHLYEYPGVHRSLLWAIRGLMFYSEKMTPKRKLICHSVYRCHHHGEYKKKATQNHKGKAADLHVWVTGKDGKMARPTDPDENKSQSNSIRTLATEKVKAQVGWDNRNKISLEPKNIAPTWVHIDVRRFESRFLEDKFFAKNSSDLDGKPLTTLL